MDRNERDRYWVTLTWAVGPQMEQEASAAAIAWFNAVGAALDQPDGVSDSEVSVGYSGFNISGVVSVLQGDGPDSAIRSLAYAVAQGFKAAAANVPFPPLPIRSTGPKVEA